MIPRKLARIIKRNNGKYHQIAREVGVNVAHVYNLIVHGTEPKRADIRERLFLPRTKRTSPRQSYRPQHINWWRHLDKEQRHAIIKKAHDNANIP